MAKGSLAGAASANSQSAGGVGYGAVGNLSEVSQSDGVVYVRVADGTAIPSAGRHCSKIRIAGHGQSGGGGVDKTGSGGSLKSRLKPNRGGCGISRSSVVGGGCPRESARSAK